MLPIYLNSWIFFYHKISERSRWARWGAVKTVKMQWWGAEASMKRGEPPTVKQ
jgi:hypothetical protein